LPVLEKLPEQKDDLDISVRSHLQEVLASKAFLAAPRLCKFLNFIIEKSLAGQAADIKEYVIALEVYERSSAYDPQVDSTVRVEASRLRRKLKAYYSNEGNSSPIRIDLPKGSYVPAFRVNTEPVHDDRIVDTDTGQANHPFVRYLAVMSLLVAMVVSVILLIGMRSESAGSGIS
jgi:hypothetical protein